MPSTQLIESAVAKNRLTLSRSEKTSTRPSENGRKTMNAT